MAFRSKGTATSSANSTTTSLTAGSPAGFVANDILLMVVSLDATIDPTITWSGGTQLFNNNLTLDGQQTVVLWKRAVGADSMVVTLNVSPTASWVVQCFAWSGRDTTNPPIGSTANINNAANASPITVTANGVTALANDDLVWIGMLDVTPATASSTFTQPTGYLSQGVTIDTLDNFDVFGVATKDAVGAGATGTVSGTFTAAGNAGWAGYLIRIPVAGGVTSFDIPQLGMMGVGF